MWSTIAISTIISTCMSIGATFYLLRRYSKTVKTTLEGIDNNVKESISTISEEIQPVIETSGKVMGIVGNMSVETRQEKALMNRVGQDILDNYEGEVAMLEVAFPRAAEYIRENPHMIEKLLPRVKALLGDQDSIDKIASQYGVKGRRRHPFMDR